MKMEKVHKIKICKNCNKEFTPKRSDAKFCSKECKMKYNNDRRKTYVTEENHSEYYIKQIENKQTETDNTYFETDKIEEKTFNLESFSENETDNVECLSDETDNYHLIDESEEDFGGYETDNYHLIDENEGDLGGYETDKIEEEQYETDKSQFIDENEGDLGSYERDDNHNNIPIKTNHHKKKKKLLRRKKNFQNNLLIGVGIATILGVSLLKKGKG